MCKVIAVTNQKGGVGYGKCEEMLFLMYDQPSTMPSDARVEFVYEPTYKAAVIMMTAYCRYEIIRSDEKISTSLEKVLNASVGRSFLGAGFERISGLLDTLEIFTKGDTFRFVECYLNMSKRFSNQLHEAITFLVTKVCLGEVRDEWSGEDVYSERAKKIIAEVQK